ncbi:uncharacterized protein LOC122319044 [Carya illinoinensis]|uniref:Uncharacterized protein n=1 Tax=Carya illinoinensis TaxID=32201 RepID=A0A8T1PUH6_CARIL|nr:uncharacterized protein LOC122319044 [Carya illinoinensis]KAG6645464.1 hypothetical protein CIPAW_08G124900 [Carya illinoinensis]
MASSSNMVAFLAVMFLVVLPMSSLGSNHTHLDDFFDKVCEEVECGRGNCSADINYPLGFKCECESGWKRTRDDNDDLTFLPCVIPNCTLDYGCQPAPPPVPQKENPHNISAFDPCYWVYCGEGTCTKNKTHTHTCQCASGYFNLLNISAFPCYGECTIGSDCSRLGITVQKSTTDGSGSGTNQATSFLPGEFHWIAILMASLCMVLWK